MKTLRKREQKRRRRNGAKTHRRRRTRRRTLRGGSTTEQIGAAAQMRAYMPYEQEGQHPVRFELNNIVHHERPNHFSDQHFDYNQAAQNNIDMAYNIIENNTDVERGIKDQMLIAKNKAQRSRMNTVTIPLQNTHQHFPHLPLRETPTTLRPKPVHVPVDVIYAPHREPQPQPQPQPTTNNQQPPPNPVHVPVNVPVHVPQNVDAARTKSLHTMLNFTKGN